MLIFGCKDLCDPNILGHNFFLPLLLQSPLRLGDRVNIDISLKDGHSMLLIFSYHSPLPNAGRSFSGQVCEAHKSLDIVGLHQHMQIYL